MPAKTPPVVVGQVLCFLNLGMSAPLIVKRLKAQKIEISEATISRIRSNEENYKKSEKPVKTGGRRSALSSIQLSSLKKMIKNPNPPDTEGYGYEAQHKH